MTKPWLGTGLSDFDSWWPTERKRGLIYRGDVDLEVLGPRGMLTVVEFKRLGEALGLAQLTWLRRRAHEPRTEVRVVRDLGDDLDDPDRPVQVWDPTAPWASRELTTLQGFRAWLETRAYRPR